MTEHHKTNNLQQVTGQETAPPNLKSSIELNHSWKDKTAIFISDFFGSVLFLSSCAVFFTLWIAWNLGLVPGLHPFDRFPFPELEMVVSLFAIILSVSVLISQNRQARRDKTRQQVEFEVNVHAENEITKMLIMLHDIQKKLGIDASDNELEQMKENLDIQQLHEKIENE